MQKFIAIGVWGLLFAVVSVFLLAQVVAQPARQTAPATAPAARRTAPAQPRTAPTPRAAQRQTTATSTSAAASTVAASGQPSKKAKAPEQLPPLLVGLYIFLLAIFLGFELISKVPPTLHTPLMSGANAISGITIVGALFCARYSNASAASVLGLLAVICAMINVVGGFLVTDRMLRMFRK